MLVVCLTLGATLMVALAGPASALQKPNVSNYTEDLTIHWGAGFPANSTVSFEQYGDTTCLTLESPRTFHPTSNTRDTIKFTVVNDSLHCLTTPSKGEWRVYLNQPDATPRDQRVDVQLDEVFPRVFDVNCANDTKLVECVPDDNPAQVVLYLSPNNCTAKWNGTGGFIDGFRGGLSSCGFLDLDVVDYADYYHQGRDIDCHNSQFNVPKDDGNEYPGTWECNIEGKVVRFDRIGSPNIGFNYNITSGAVAPH